MSKQTCNQKELEMNENGRENYDNTEAPKTAEDVAADEAAKSAGNEEVTKEIEHQSTGE